MDERNCGFSEQEIVDYTLGSLPEDRSVELRKHVNGCRSCFDQLQEWSGLLGSSQEDPLPRPPSRLKTGLKLKFILWKRFPAIVRGMLWSKRTAVAAGLASLFLLVLGLFHSLKEPADLSKLSPMPIERIATEFHPDDRNLTMLADPKTVQYKMTSLNANEAEGYVWVNRLSDEVFLLVAGLEPSSEKDYQAWFIFNTVNARENGGILKWEKGMAHLYVHGGKISGADNITISLEPKGGSYAPIGPHTLLVTLEK